MNVSIDLNINTVEYSVMQRKEDKISEKILNLVDKANEPLETVEVINSLKETRVVILYRLNMLRGDGLLKGKQVGSGKGTWIWWKNG